MLKNIDKQKVLKLRFGLEDGRAKRRSSLSKRTSRF